MTRKDRKAPTNEQLRIGDLLIQRYGFHELDQELYEGEFEDRIGLDRRWGGYPERITSALETIAEALTCNDDTAVEDLSLASHVKQLTQHLMQFFEQAQNDKKEPETLIDIHRRQRFGKTSETSRR